MRRFLYEMMDCKMRRINNRAKAERGVTALVTCLFFCAAFTAFTTACQPRKSGGALTPIPVDQTETTVEQTSEVPQDTPAAQEMVSADTLQNPAKELLDSASTLPGAVPVSVTHITQEAETLSAGITVLVNADVVIPQVEGYHIRECNMTSFSLDEYRKMIDYFLPDAKGAPNQEAHGVQADGTYDLKDFDLVTGTTFTLERDGEGFSLQLGGKNSVFWVERADEIIYREGYLIGDEEWEQEAGEIIRAPITLTREAAQAQAQKVISDLDIHAWQIESVQRAVAFDLNHSSTVRSRGWAFVYGLSDAGLTMHADSGYSSSKNDRLSYWKANAGTLTIYVDERGVSDFHWEKRYEPSNVVYSNVSIISAEEALKLAKDRIARIYGEVAYENAQIEIYDIRLSTMLIGYSDRLTGKAFPEVYEDIALLIPTWNISFREIYSKGDTEYFTMPFCAVDGGAVSMLFY
jgi:hypothetical protein